MLKREGFKGATTNRIAQEAGVGVGTLYEYFANKEALSRAVLEQSAQRKLQRMVEAVPSLGDLSAARAIEQMVKLWLELVTEQCQLTRLLLQESIYISLEDEPEEIAEGFHALIHGFLTDRRQELRPLNTEMVTFLLLNTLDATVRTVVRNRPEYLRDPAFRRELTTLIGTFVLEPGAN